MSERITYSDTAPLRWWINPLFDPADSQFCPPLLTLASFKSLPDAMLSTVDPHHLAALRGSPAEGTHEMAATTAEDLHHSEVSLAGEQPSNTSAPVTECTSDSDIIMRMPSEDTQKERCDEVREEAEDEVIEDEGSPLMSKGQVEVAHQSRDEGSLDRIQVHQVVLSFGELFG